MITEDNILIQLQKTNIITQKNHINPKYKIMLCKRKETYNMLLEHTSFLPKESTTYERIYCVLHNITTQPKCLRCNEPSLFAQNTFGYYQTCGKKECFVEAQKTTWNKKYGGHPCSSSDIIKKRKATNLKKYGVENSLHSKEIRAKYNITEIIKKQKETFLKKYGEENPSRVLSVKEKKKQTALVNFGVEHPWANAKIRKDIKATNLKKYNRKYSNQTHMSTKTLKLLNDKQWLIEQHHTKQRTLASIAETLNVTPTTVGNYCKTHNISIKYYFRSEGERQVGQFIKDLGVDITTNNRKVIFPYELDVFIPSLNIAFEFNGTYWHGPKKPEQQKRDVLKQKLCDQKNITLITILEEDWNTKKEEIKKSIMDILLY